MPVANGFSIVVQGESIMIVKDMAKPNDGNLSPFRPTSIQNSMSNSNENFNPSILTKNIAKEERKEDKKEDKKDEHKKSPLQIKIPVDIKDKSPKNSGTCCGMKEVCRIF